MTVMCWLGFFSGMGFMVLLLAVFAVSGGYALELEEADRYNPLIPKGRWTSADYLDRDRERDAR